MKSEFRHEPDEYSGFVRQQIKQARKVAKMTQGQLGKAIAKSSVVISDIERGRTQISLRDLARISSATRQPINFFFPNFLSSRGLQPQQLTEREKELVRVFRQLRSEKFEAILLEQIKKLAKLADEIDLEGMATAIEEESVRGFQQQQTKRRRRVK